MDCLVEHNRFVEVLSSDVDVGSACPHCIACNQAALNELVRVLPHDLTVLQYGTQKQADQFNSMCTVGRRSDGTLLQVELQYSSKYQGAVV